MSPLQNGEDILDEEILAKGHNGDTRANAQQSVSYEEKESLNPIAFHHRLSTVNPLENQIESPRTGHSLQAESTTDTTAAHAKSNELCQTPPQQVHSILENNGSALNISNCLPPTDTDGPIPSEKIGPQDQADGHAFPEGGLRAWLVVLGSFSGMTASFGILNSAGTFQAYLSTHQLVLESPSAVGWIFSLYAFLTFFCGVQIGPVFDAYGPRWLVFAGSVFLVGGMMGVAESSSKWCLLLYMILRLLSSSPSCLTCLLTSLSPFQNSGISS